MYEYLVEIMNNLALLILCHMNLWPLAAKPTCIADISETDNI